MCCRRPLKEALYREATRGRPDALRTELRVRDEKTGANVPYALRRRQVRKGRDSLRWYALKIARVREGDGRHLRLCALRRLQEDGRSARAGHDQPPHARLLATCERGRVRTLRADGRQGCGGGRRGAGDVERVESAALCSGARLYRPSRRLSLAFSGRPRPANHDASAFSHSAASMLTATARPSMSMLMTSMRPWLATSFT